MFHAMPHQFLATTTSTTPSSTTSLPLSFSLQNANNFQQQQYYQEQQHQQRQLCFDDSYFLHHQQGTNTINESKEESVVVANSVVIPTCLVQVGSEPSSIMVPDQCEVVEPWSSEEVLCLLKIISSLDSPWFPSQFTWDNVSRKLAEFGFIRSAEICKEKFEEETSNFNNNRHKRHLIGQNYRLFGELEELYNNNTNTNNNDNDNDNDDININNDDEGGDYCDDSRDNVNNDLDEHDNKEVEKIGLEKLRNDYDNNNIVGEEDDRQKRVDDRKKVTRKRKREKKKFEMFKGFCENIVSKMIAQQEEMHSKILEEMVKRDEEKIAKEEAWKKQEIDRITQVMQVRAHEQAIVGDRQAKILGFLKKFSSSSSSNNSLLSTSSSILSQDSISATTKDQNLGPQSPTTNPMSGSQGDLCGLALDLSCKSLRIDHTSTDATGQGMSFGSLKGHIDSKVIIGDVKDDIGRRWPRDEVLALINIRCNPFSNNNGDHRDRESFSKGPLWERISQKMMELGYKRSAKRCKEKWENINKYFRKTKDLNKKRSIDSRTCPYFHQLSHLYNQGTPHGQSDRPTNQYDSSGNQLVPTLGAQERSSNVSDGATITNVNPVQENEGIVVQLPTCQVSSVLNFDYSIT